MPFYKVIKFHTFLDIASFKHNCNSKNVLLALSYPTLSQLVLASSGSHGKEGKQKLRFFAIISIPKILTHAAILVLRLSN